MIYSEIFMGDFFWGGGGDFHDHIFFAMNLLVRVKSGYTPNFTFLWPMTLLVRVGWLDNSEWRPTWSLLDLALGVAKGPIYFLDRVIDWDWFLIYQDWNPEKVKVSKRLPHPSMPPLVRPQKCQSFVQRLRETRFPEGNQLSVISPL